MMSSTLIDVKVKRYNKKRKRWEYRCFMCGALIWTKISRVRIYGNLYRHYMRKHYA